MDITIINPLEEFVAKVNALLDNSVLPAYCYGSATYNDFHIGYSDLGFFSIHKCRSQRLVYSRLEVLINILKDDEELFVLSKYLTDGEILRGKKPPSLREGDEVEVIVNAKNITYHRGHIYEMKWYGNEASRNDKDKKYFWY